MDANTLPLINEFLRVLGEDVLLRHLANDSTESERDMIAVSTRVLLDEWAANPWATVSQNGDRLLELFPPETNP